MATVEENNKKTLNGGFNTYWLGGQKEREWGGEEEKAGQNLALVMM